MSAFITPVLMTWRLAEGIQDFGYALGVLHHIPQTEAAIAACVRKLKPRAPFLVYIYYAFDNRPPCFRAIWKASNVVRHVISKMPFPLRKGTTIGIAAAIYYPLSRTARWLKRRGRDVSTFPLGSCCQASFYTMKTGALDRLGTRLEQVLPAPRSRPIMTRCGLTHIAFRDQVSLLGRMWAEANRLGCMRIASVIRALDGADRVQIDAYAPLLGDGDSAP